MFNKILQINTILLLSILLSACGSSNPSNQDNNDADKQAISETNNPFALIDNTEEPTEESVALLAETIAIEEIAEQQTTELSQDFEPENDTVLLSPDVQLLRWEAPTQRVNGEPLEPGELVSYEIMAGYGPYSLFWIHTYLPNDPTQTELELDLVKTLGLTQEQGLAHELDSYRNETLYFAVIAIDEEGNRSAMSSLKAITVQL